MDLNTQFYFDRLLFEIEDLNGKYKWHYVDLEEEIERSSKLFDTPEECHASATIQGWQQRIAKDPIPSAIILPSHDLILHTNSAARQMLKMPAEGMLKDDNFWESLQEKEDYRRNLKIDGRNERKVTLRDGEGNKVEILADDRLLLIGEIRIVIARALI